MKATDLMIGDWVLAEGKLTQVTDIDEYDGINRDWVCGIEREDLGCISWEYIEPIPLTSEILDKNGYVFQDWWYEQKGYPDITNMFSGDKYEVGKHAYYGKGQPEFNSIIQIQYVHELQHALKLCGIEKYIEL